MATVKAKPMTPAQRKKAVKRVKGPINRRRPRKLTPEVTALNKTYPELALILVRARAFISADGRIMGGDGDLWQAGCDVPFTDNGRARYADVRTKG